MNCQELKNKFVALTEIRKKFQESLGFALKSKDVKDVLNQKFDIEFEIENIWSMLPVSPEKAKEIMGKDYFGSEEIKKALDFIPEKQKVVPIPFSKEELRRAKELGMFLILRIDDEAAPLTIPVLNIIIRSNNEGNVPSCLGIDQHRQYFHEEKPRLGWALVNTKTVRHPMSGIPFMDPGEKIMTAIAHLEKMYQLTTMPGEYQEAIKEAREFLKSNMIKGVWEGRLEDIKHLAELKISKLCGAKAVEIFYDMAVYLANRSDNPWKNNDHFGSSDIEVNSVDAPFINLIIETDPRGGEKRIKTYLTSENETSRIYLSLQK